MVLDILTKCLQHVHGPHMDLTTIYTKRIESLADDITRTIPYHFQLQCTEHDDRSPLMKGKFFMPAKAMAGGFLILHPLWVLLRYDSVPARTKKVASDTLAWMDRKLGIGQAGLMIDVSLTVSLAMRH